MSSAPGLLGLVLGPISGIETPLQETQWLLDLVFLLALAVGITYVFLLLWTLAKHISHEPLAQNRPTRPARRPAPPKNSMTKGAP